MAFESPYDPKPVRDWAAQEQPYTTVPELFRKSVQKNANSNFLGWKAQGKYHYLTYEQVQQKIHQFACALIELGLKPGDRVALLSENRPEWVITDMGIFHAGCVNAPLYPSLAEEAVEYILKDSGARVVVAASDEHLSRILAVEKDLPKLEHVVTMSGKGSHASAKKLWDWDEFLAHGVKAHDSCNPTMEERVAALKPSDVCSLVYTSGTTGDPKGAMLMHGNFCSNCAAVLPHINVTAEDVELSFLPLSHVFERCVYYAMAASGATIVYAESIDTVRDNLLEVQPTVVPSVPRLFEKIHAGVLAKVEAGPKPRQGVFHWALGVGRRHFEAKMEGEVPGWLKLQYAFAHKLALAKIHQATGGNIRLFISGGAPLRKDVGEFFLHAGFNLVEGYGLTETSPVITMNPPGRPRMGTVGKTISNVECKIAGDGEIITRGPHVMLGYFNKTEATADAIDDEGWFHTGDVGEFDDDDYLRITDRKKEILVMSNGKNVAPQPIEQAIKSSPFIEQAVLIGDNRNFISALVVPAFEALKTWAKENGVDPSPEAMADSDKLREFLLKEVERTCEDFSRYEQVKNIALLPHELTQHTGELTPTLKVKRRVVNEKYKHKIDAIYSTPAPA